MRESYLEVVLSGYLNLKGPLWTENGDAAAVLLSYLLIAVGFGLPLLNLWVLSQPLDRFSEPSFRAKWGSFFEKVKVENKYALAYYLVFMLRRLALVMIAFWFRIQVF